MFTGYIYRISQVRGVAATVACQDSTCFQGWEKVEGIDYGTIPLKEITQI